MSAESNTDDSSGPVDATLALIISSLREHEQNLDRLIGKLNDIKLQENTIKELDSQIEKLSTNVSNLDRDLKHLIVFFGKANARDLARAAK